MCDIREGEFDDSGREGVWGGSAFEETLCGTAVVVEDVPVITAFKRSVDDAITAAAGGAVCTTEGIGVVGVQRAVVTDFSCIDTGIAAEGGKESDLGRGEAAAEDATGGGGTVGIGEAGGERLAGCIKRIEGVGRGVESGEGGTGV